MTSYQCPVCGYNDLEDPPYLPSGKPSYEYCDCCAFQFGYTDDNSGYTFDTWRQKWIGAGMPWDWGESEAPADWDPVAQLKNLASE